MDIGYGLEHLICVKPLWWCWLSREQSWDSKRQARKEKVVKID